MFKQIKEFLRFARVRAWYKRYERLLLPGVILFGLIGDFIAVRYINLPVVQIILTVHIILSGLWIVVIHSKTGAVKETRAYKYIQLFAPLALYYSFSAMFSMFLVLYSNSGSLFSSAPFLIVIVALLVGIEVFKKPFKKLTVQVTVYFMAVLSYATLVVPYISKEVSSTMFLISGSMSLLYIWGYLFVLRKFSSEVRSREKFIGWSIAGIFLFINILYFANLIPPFPLSLRDIGIYHSVERVETGAYHGAREERSFLDIISPVDTIRIAGERATLSTYSSIFAPTDISMDVVHEWKRFVDGRFRVVSRVEYPIVGGRDGGYRGYTYSSQITPGLWWVTVETGEGKVIGGTMFRVVTGENVKPTVVDEF